MARWASADPLAVHAPGEADLNLYAYVHGRVYVAVDPEGLREARAPQPTDAHVAALNTENRGVYEDARADFDKEFARLDRAIAKDERWLQSHPARGRRHDGVARRLAAAEARWDSLIRTERDWLSAVEMGNDAFTLGRVVWNEAGWDRIPDAARTAVAYAYLNRTGGVVRAPRNAEISHSSTISTRMRDAHRVAPFAQNQAFGSALRAAVARLADAQPTTNDPTGGARHWVSPEGLDRGPRGDGFYQRDFGGRVGERSFPSWAISNDAFRSLRPAERSRYWRDDYQERTVAGVPAPFFLFYRGVR
jgi:hypothetical protein